MSLMVNEQFNFSLTFQDKAGQRMSDTSSPKELFEIASGNKTAGCYTLNGLSLNLNADCSCRSSNTCGHIAELNKNAFKDLNKSKALVNAGFRVEDELIETVQLSRQLLNQIMNGDYKKSTSSSKKLLLKSNSLNAIKAQIARKSESFDINYPKYKLDLAKVTTPIYEDLVKSKQIRKEKLEDKRLAKAIFGKRSKPTYDVATYEDIKIDAASKDVGLTELARDLEQDRIKRVAEDEEFAQNNTSGFSLDEAAKVGLSDEENRRRSTGSHEISKDKDRSIFDIITNRYLKSLFRFE